MPTAFIGLVIALTLGLWGNALAHELQASRATLVLRDSQHLALTFFIDYPAVLHLTLAPQMLFHEFALQHAAMPPQLFAAQLLPAQRKLQGNTRLASKNGKTLGLTSWAWPDATTTQKALQQRAIEAVVGTGEHTHSAPMEIRAEAQSNNAKDFALITLQLPPEFKQTLVVSYQPRQVWAEPGKASPGVRFLP